MMSTRESGMRTKKGEANASKDQMSHGPDPLPEKVFVHRKLKFSFQTEGD